MVLTRVQIDQELGSSLEGTPIYKGRENNPLFEELEFIEVVINEGEYCYHLDILLGNANQFGARDGKGIALSQLQL